MEDDTREIAMKLIDAIEALADADVSVSRFTLTEYCRGDPTADPTVTGAEIELTAYVSYDDADRNDSPFRVK